MLRTAAVCSVVVCFLVFAMHTPAQSYATAAGDRAREIAGWDMVGQQPVRLSDYAGQWVFVEFWASWCGPCVRELPNMIVQTKPYVDAGRLNVITVTIDEPESTGDMRKLIKKHRMPYPVIYDYEEELCEIYGIGSVAAGDFGVSGVPTSFLINPQGVIIASEIRGEKMGAMLDYYLNAERPLTSLRGRCCVNDDRSLSFVADVMNTAMEDVEVQLFAYREWVYWDEKTGKYEVDFNDSIEPLDTAVISFADYCEASYEFILPADEDLHNILYYLKAMVPGTEFIHGEDQPGIQMMYMGESTILIDLEVVDGEIIVYGPTVQYYGRR